MISFALLQKELVDQARNKRTYTLRVFYVAAIYSIYCSIYASIARQGGLGHGAKLFNVTMSAQWAGILLLLPAFASNVITDERERNTLSLLTITRIGLWQIVLQKYLSRLIPMLTFLLVALPLHAISFRSGGIEASQLIEGTQVQIGACLLIAATSLLSSGIARTTSGAMVIAYASSVLLAFSLAVLHESISASSLLVAQIVLAIATLLLTRRVVRLFPDGAPGFGLQLFNKSALTSTFMPDLALADAMGNHPVAWRENRRLTFRHPTWLRRNIFTPEMFASVFFLILILIGETTEAGFLFWNRIPITFFWYFVVIRLTVITINTFAHERIDQTLDVLLTTNIDGFQLLYQKMVALHQYIRSLWIPFGVYYIGRVLIMGAFSNLDFTVYVFPYLALGAACVWVYLPLFMWLAMWVNLRVHHRNKAVMITLGIILIGSDVLVGIVILLTDLLGIGGYLIALPAMLSPMAFISRTERLIFYHDIPHPMATFIMILFSLGAFYMYARLTRGFQRSCTTNTEALLRGRDN